MVAESPGLTGRRQRIERGNRIVKVALTVVVMMIGAALMMESSIDQAYGTWRQHQLATATDGQSSRYAAALRNSYNTIHSEMEALVAFEVGALPTTVDGTVIGLPARMAASGPVERSIAQDPIGRLSGSNDGSAAPVDQIREAPPPQVPATFDGGTIRIPAIGVNQAIVSGVSRSDLRSGPGHYPGTALPGQTGNTVISGHRTTYTRPFYDLDKLESGDVIWVDTSYGSFKYIVEGFQVVDPSNLAPLRGTIRPVLTLTTCTPKGSARQRLIITAALAGEQPLVRGQ